jgi:hypothetical protein
MIAQAAGLAVLAAISPTVLVLAVVYPLSFLLCGLVSRAFFCNEIAGPCTT